MGLFGVTVFQCITMGFSSPQWGACDPRLGRTVAGEVWEQTVMEEGWCSWQLLSTGCECLWQRTELQVLPEQLRQMGQC